ncbi:hypothetical protein LCGC14_2294700 [marine sediment metagenome]|uniref:Uncharacterized protein n=1 Tax=marine sediment metagenome TaxID=412755 RepID=A0A0F9F2N7_9ZZZZ
MRPVLRVLRVEAYTRRVLVTTAILIGLIIFISLQPTYVADKPQPTETPCEANRETP